MSDVGTFNESIGTVCSSGLIVIWRPPRCFASDGIATAEPAAATTVETIFESVEFGVGIVFVRIFPI